MSDYYRVSLTNSSNQAERVLIEATPELVETRNVNYKTTDPVHAPGQIFSYVNSSSRTFNLSGIKLISRTQEEASKNLQNLWYFRSWTMPVFGRGSALSQAQRDAREVEQADLWNSRQQGISDAEYQARLRELGGDSSLGTDLRGRPPVVLLLTAYSPSGGTRSTMGHIHRVPVVIQNLSIPYPADVDYIPSRTGVPMPTIMTIDMTLTETHSPLEYSSFSLTNFKQGMMGNF